MSDKLYLADKKPFFRHFQQPYITLTALKSAALAGGYALMVSPSQAKSEDDDSDSADSHVVAQDTENTTEDKILTKKEDESTPLSVNDYAVQFMKYFTASLSYTTCLRTLEEIAITHLRPQIADKLIKDVSKSAVRKAMRTGSSATASFQIFKTGIRANVLPYVAYLLVDVTTSTTAAFVRSYRKLRKKEAKKLLRDSSDETVTTDSRLTSGILAAAFAVGVFLRVTNKNARGMYRAVVGGAVGGAVGTLVRPGIGTFIGANIGEGLLFVF